jgi:hypothetical protein
MITIIDAIHSLRPGAEWSLNGRDYGGLNWFESNTQPKPTKEEVEAEIQRLQEEYDKRYYWEEFRRIKNSLLTDSDWTQSRDVLLDNDQEWKDYRQTLRDLSDNIDDPKFLVLDPNHSDWPTPPS